MFALNVYYAHHLFQIARRAVAWSIFAFGGRNKDLAGYHVFLSPFRDVCAFQMTFHCTAPLTAGHRRVWINPLHRQIPKQFL
jgi:hypothetical protein